MNTMKTKDIQPDRYYKVRSIRNHPFLINQVVPGYYLIQLIVEQKIPSIKADIINPPKRIKKVAKKKKTIWHKIKEMMIGAGK